MQLILSPHIYVTSIKGTQMTALHQLSHLSSPEPLSYFFVSEVPWLKEFISYHPHTATTS